MKKMKTRTIYKPNYKKAQNAAYELLKVDRASELPVKVKKFAKYFPNLKIRSYSWFANRYGLTLQEVCEYADSDEGCCWYRKAKNKYMILYNDTKNNVGRVRWTIAHELGHFVLRHNELSDKTIIARSSLSNEEYDVFEKEANCFARTLLAPPNVLVALDHINPHFISELCLLSYEAASNVYKFITEGMKKGIRYSTNHPIIEAFSSYIFREKNKKDCLTCNCTFVSKNALFCPICGGNNIIKKGMGEYMKYSGIEIDELGRAIVCPVCQNEAISGLYCQICGTYLINRCTGFDDEPNNRFKGSWHDLQGCGKILEGNARFCIDCGSTSTFYESGLLRGWEQIQKERFQEETNAEVAATEEYMYDPFTDTIVPIRKNTNDDDLPF
ncbi:ImmA/IrrE family metallo-endopeptidase [Brevibacillus agri]|uniref:ImmA/IrrE family metallo-endopeptidase n=1 Tax=Brevibacillus agri TaxID=51101 RepID=UPI002E1D69BD|nr:ImmA/IrrE family metallo-endopeptidase [Brevibacillus agri]MED1653871.1 ImmA/IrrE family metallo-endopeptidase [Brevibacillus agri]MED1686710.1 ImmA/IrrE family metallo-endopeptidase [Brevibacillus agri]MED1691969.1 ImmA/IrrE family metallo-endopeptidase [Brevibacillus agri]MED1696026.1 ImmA/IrrE family metallo-endopeptidase [Brevibacillus agri]